MSAVWLAGFDFSSRFLPPSSVASVETHADVRGPQKHPTLKAKLTSRLGSLAVLIAYLLECKKDVKLKTTAVEVHRHPRRNSVYQTNGLLLSRPFRKRRRLLGGVFLWI